MDDQPRQGILPLIIDNKEDLYRAYMPFVTGGGVFIPTKRGYRLGEEVFVLLKLMEEPEKIPVVGNVIWMTPRDAQNGREAGIGIQLAEKEGEDIRSKLETYLAGMLKSDRATFTM